MMRLGLFVMILVSSLRADLSEIRSEPNLEKRARLALNNADTAFKDAQASYASGNNERTRQQLGEMQQSVEVAHDALAATGKNPRRRPKYFKIGETETRDLLRRLEGLENAMSVDDRAMIEAPKAKVQEVHDEWLSEIISGK